MAMLHRTKATEVNNGNPKRLNEIIADEGYRLLSFGSYIGSKFEYDNFQRFFDSGMIFW